MIVSLDRFADAQERTYAQALGELRAGSKTSHWMWYVFPQIAGLGQSQTARFYAIAGHDEGLAYLAHPLLGARLAATTDAIMLWAGRRDLVSILGAIDAQKFRSSMTLFEALGAPYCAAALDAFCQGSRDEPTLQLLNAGAA